MNNLPAPKKQIQTYRVMDAARVAPYSPPRSLVAPLLPRCLYVLGVSVSIAFFLQSLSWKSRPKFEPTILQYVESGILYLGLISIFSIWLLTTSTHQLGDLQRTSFRRLVVVSSPFLLLAFLSYPSTSDIFTYLHSGLMVLNGVNPYLVPAGSFQSPISPHLYWDQTSTYGPLSQLVFALAGAPASYSVTVAVYWFKFICLFFHLLSAFLIWEFSAKSLDRSLVSLAYLVNPIMLFEYIAQAHVDVLLNFITIASLILLFKQRYVLSSIGLMAGALCKTLPVIWLLLLGSYLIGRRLWKPLAYSVLLGICVCALLWATVLPTFRAWVSLLNAGVVWQTAGSIHNILDSTLNYGADLLPSVVSGVRRYRITMPFKVLTYGLYFSFFLWLCCQRLRHPRDEKQLVLDMGWSALVLFLFATPWYQPWYATILISFVAILAARGGKEGIALFGMAAAAYGISSTSYYVLSFPEGFFAVASLITVAPVLSVLLMRRPSSAR
jgi:alpha-1,6-mannosyltransferase